MGFGAGLLNFGKALGGAFGKAGKAIGSGLSNTGNGLSNTGNLLTNAIGNTVQGTTTPDYGSIGNVANNVIQGKNDYGAIGNAINDYVNTPSKSILGENLLKGATKAFDNGAMEQETQETPNISFNPSMMTPNYIQSSYTPQQSYINKKKSNLYDLLTGA